MADILAVMDISTIATALTTLFVAGMGFRLLFVGYRAGKQGLNKI